VSVKPYIDQYGYWAVFTAILLEDFGVPVLGVTLLIAAPFWLPQRTHAHPPASSNRVDWCCHRRQHRIRHRSLRWKTPATTLRPLPVRESAEPGIHRGFFQEERGSCCCSPLLRGATPTQRHCRGYRQNALVAISALQRTWCCAMGRFLEHTVLPVGRESNRDRTGFQKTAGLPRCRAHHCCCCCSDPLDATPQVADWEIAHLKYPFPGKLR
jgi:hypothetical protein